MLHAANALGYGGCWVQRIVINHQVLFRKLLNIPNGWYLFSLVTIGEIDKHPKKVYWKNGMSKEKKPLEELLMRERFEQC